jgi:hypothetical protein
MAMIKMFYNLDTRTADSGETWKSVKYFWGKIEKKNPQLSGRGREYELKDLGFDPQPGQTPRRKARMP